MRFVEYLFDAAWPQPTTQRAQLSDSTWGWFCEVKATSDLEKYYLARGFAVERTLWPCVCLPGPADPSWTLITTIIVSQSERFCAVNSGIQSDSQRHPIWQPTTSNLTVNDIQSDSQRLSPS